MYYILSHDIRETSVKQITSLLPYHHPLFRFFPGNLSHGITLKPIVLNRGINVVEGLRG
jgi:hypothetical protein